MKNGKQLFQAKIFCPCCDEESILTVTEYPGGYKWDVTKTFDEAKKTEEEK